MNSMQQQRMYLMSIPNLIALLLLSGTVAKLVKEFFAGEGAR